MLDATLRRELVELISASFNNEQIEELGRLVLGSFDLLGVVGVEKHITVSSRRAASALVEDLEKHKRENELIRLVVESDGSTLLGRQVSIPGVENFLDGLTRSGFVYDFGKRKLVSVRSEPVEIPNWGALREGKTYAVTIASMDIVGSTELAKSYGVRKMKKLMHLFRGFLMEKLRYYDGRMWSWEGDGGLIAFTFKNHETRATQCALDLQRTVRVFTSTPGYPLGEHICLRIGMDSGSVTFHHETGRILSDTINFAAHLEKKMTQPGSVGISEPILMKIPDTLSDAFSKEEVLEDRSIFMTERRMDEF